MRTTVAALAVVGLALVVGALVLVAVLRATLTREVRNAALLRGQDVAAVLASGPGSGRLAVDDTEEQLIQVFDPDGRVVDASPNAVGLQPVARLRPGESAKVEPPAGAPLEGGELLAVATGADTPQGRRTVVVVRSTETVTEATAAVGGLLVVGLPLLLVVVAATTWIVVGRALAPVESIRAEVDAISAAALHRRVLDPPADDEIGRLARTMNRMLGRLEQAQARQRRLVSDASHELRSPVAVIRQHAEVALAHPGRTTTTGLAETVLAEDLRLGLAEDLLLLTRPTSTPCPAAPAGRPRRPGVRRGTAAARGDRVAGRHHRGVGRPGRRRRRRAAAGAAEPRRQRRPPRGRPPGPVGRRGRRPGRAGGRRRRSASQRRTGSGCSSGSSASTTPAPATTGAAASAWPSWPSWSRPTAARSPSPPAPSAAPGSRSPSLPRRPRRLRRLRHRAVPASRLAERAFSGVQALLRHASASCP